MPTYSSDIAFSPAVKRLQEIRGSRQGYAKMEEGGGWQTTVSADLAGFIGTRDSFYLGTASADGQPYIQHRGGPRGFLKVINETTLGFADYRGNRQYISAGNLSENNKAYLFLMDYPNRRRVKIWGRARIVEDPEQAAGLVGPGGSAVPERAILIDVSAWDVNCPQHITPRFTQAEVEAEVEAQVAPLKQRIAELESRLSIA